MDTEHRRAADRHGLRYPSDLSNAEWALVEPMIPPASRGGRKRSIDIREVLNAIFYVLWTGCQWKALPKDLPPKSTAHYYFMLWDWDGTLERIHHALYGFEVVPKRWIVERTIAWISRFRRLARDFERYARTVAAFIRLAMVRIMLRRLTRSNLCR